jgi:hypothetical protein
MKVICVSCLGEFERLDCRVKRSLKLGKQLFCSSKCYGSSLLVKERLAKFVVHLIPGGPDKLSPFRYYIQNVKAKIKRYGETDLTLEYISELWCRQNGICPYSNLSMVLPKTKKQFFSIVSPFKASLDRIDSKLGYIRGNVEFVCLAINYAKNKFTKVQFQEFLTALKKFNGPQ